SPANMWFSSETPAPGAMDQRLGQGLTIKRELRGATLVPPVRRLRHERAAPWLPPGRLRHYTDPAIDCREPLLQTRGTRLVLHSTRARILPIAVLAVCTAALPAAALPRRSLVARPLPPSVLAASEANG